MNKSCKKVYCNKKCKGFPQTIKDIKNGFKKTISKKKRKKLIEKGVLSGCVDITYYKI